MSYSDPKIIVDRSAEIYAQGANQLGQTMVGFVEKKYADEAVKREAETKRLDAIGLASQQSRKLADEEIEDAVKGLPRSLADQVIDKLTKGWNEAITLQRQYAIDPTKATLEDTNALRKKIINLKLEGQKHKDYYANVVADNEEVEEQKASLGTRDANWVLSGRTPLEQLQNYLRSESQMGNGLPGLRTEATDGKDASGNAQVTHTSTLDSKDPTMMKLIESNGLKVDENGIATVTSTGTLGNFKDTLTPVPVDFEATELKALEGLFKADGSLGDVAYFPETEYSDREVLNGKATERSSSRIFNEKDYLKVTKDQYESFAVGILAKDQDQQFAYLQSRLGDTIEFKDWNKKTKPERIAYISDKVKENDLKARKASMWSRVATVEEKGAGKAAEDGMIYYKSKPTSLKDLKPQNPPESTPTYFEQPEIKKVTASVNERFDGKFSFTDTGIQKFELARQGDYGDTKKQTYYYNKTEDGKIIISTDKEEILDGIASPRDTFNPRDPEALKRAKEQFGIDIPLDTSNDVERDNNIVPTFISLK